MASDNTKKKGKFRLGKKTDVGYEFSTKIDFREDFATQIASLMKEKTVNDELELKIKRLRREVKKFAFREKDRSLSYYYAMGKNLLFLDKKTFCDISQYSVYRRIAKEIPIILPHIKDKKVIEKHLETMYRLAHLDRKYLKRASWDQWYEIAKFKKLFTKKKFYRKILEIIEGKKVSGPRLRSTIREWIKGVDRREGIE